MKEVDVNIQIAFAPKDALQAQAFFEAYTENTIASCPDQKMTGLTQKKDRTCRFCKKKMPEVKFKKEAHVFPEALGNRYLVSDFECDACNELFGKYENDLAIFLGPLMAFQGIKGKQKHKSFKSADGRLRVDEIQIRQDVQGVSIQKSDPNDTSLTIRSDSGETSITYTKGSYTPLKVYKAVLKMALCCLSEKDFSQYEDAVQYLLSEKHDKNLTGAQYLFIHRKPYTMGNRSPVGITYRKIDPLAKIPTHVFVLLFANVIYQIQIPLHAEDIKLLYNEPGVKHSVPICPPFYSDIQTALSTPTTYVALDLSSTEIKRGEIEKVLMQSSPEDLASAGTYDPKTKTHSDGADYNEVVKLIMAKQDDKVTLDELADIVREKNL